MNRLQFITTLFCIPKGVKEFFKEEKNNNNHGCEITHFGYLAPEAEEFKHEGAIHCNEFGKIKTAHFLSDEEATKLLKKANSIK